jgi:hypothetical protein
MLDYSEHMKPRLSSVNRHRLPSRDIRVCCKLQLLQTVNVAIATMHHVYVSAACARPY